MCCAKSLRKSALCCSGARETMPEDVFLFVEDHHGAHGGRDPVGGFEPVAHEGVEIVGVDHGDHGMVVGDDQLFDAIDLFRA